MVSKKLENFDINHHESTRKSHDSLLERWRVETEEAKVRCKSCWLRSYNCFCPTLATKRKFYEANYNMNHSVVLYYHHQEIGRSANTGHVFANNCSFMCDTIVFGGSREEQQLLQDIEREYLEGNRRTCVLYPSNSATLLSEWSSNSSEGARLVMLDGTYPQANRQMKYIDYFCKLRGIPTPVVKLDLSKSGCKSAIAGVMSQPGKEKVCTYQAIVLALNQLGVPTTICNSLNDDLESYLLHILKLKVKFGKSVPRKSVQEVDNTPNKRLLQHLVSVCLI